MASRKSQAGQALIIMALALPMIFGMAGLAVDVGYLLVMQRLAQSAADSGAVAGAMALNYGNVTQGAQAATALAGFSNGAGGVAINVNNPPLNGPHAANAQYVEVIVTQNNPTFLLKMIGIRSTNVAARAVAYLGTGTAPGCLYLLSPSGTGINITGSGTISAANGCGITVDSNSSSAINLTGSGSITASSIGIVGGDSITGSASITPNPATGIVPVNDPLAYLTPPAVGTCANAALNITGSGTSTVTPGTNCYNVSVTGSNTVTFNPGEYSAISITGSATVTFTPGVYVIAKGGLSLTGSGSVTGSGVTFYLGPNAGSLTSTGSSNFNLVAPTSGTYQGILFYQDKGDTSNASFTGSTTDVFQGTLYFPTAGIQWTGSGNAAAYTIIVAQSLTLTGSTTLNLHSNYNGLSGGSPIKNPVLVE
jgi:hypothetical protein